MSEILSSIALNIIHLPLAVSLNLNGIKSTSVSFKACRLSVSSILEPAYGCKLTWSCRFDLYVGLSPSNAIIPIPSFPVSSANLAEPP